MHILGTALEELEILCREHGDWMFGQLSVTNLKNETENMHSSNEEHGRFPDTFVLYPRRYVNPTAMKRKICIGCKREGGQFDLNETRSLVVLQRIPSDP
jgi:hypothetical protein